MRILLLCWAFFSASAYSVVETYEFEDEALRQRYQVFVDELRCPKCQNQNLAGSNSPIAQDLRREVYRLLSEGNSDQQVVEFMVDRYGEFILYRPRFNAETVVLWLAPAIFLLLGLLVLVKVFLRQKKSVSNKADSELLNESEQQRLQALLAKDLKDDSND